MTRAALQAKVGLEKQAHPERFCPAKSCLWRTHGKYCRRHGKGDMPSAHVHFTDNDGYCSICKRVII
jgi:hypothetical protein